MQLNDNSFLKYYIMKKIIYTIIAILLLTTGASAIQPSSLLSVGSSGFSIKSGTVFSVKGLVLTPSADVTITNNSIRFSGTAITNSSDQSINRVYTFTSPQSSYSGLVGIRYGVGELNGNTESALQIAYNPLSSGGSFVVSSGSNTGGAGSYYVSNTLSSVNLGVVTALPTFFPPPTATTNAATSIALTEAMLNGSVNANGASTTVTFEYGTTTSYGTTVTATPGTATSSSAVMVSYALTGLTPNTTYHYRVVGVSPGGTTNGDDQTFTTSTAGPTITGNPPNRTICVGSNTTFAVTATGATGYQWQVNTGSGFTNLSNGAPYSGITSATLTITGATASMNGYTYRCVVTGSSSVNSNSGTLTVPDIIVTTTSQTNVYCNGDNDGSATISATGGIGPYSYSWSPYGGTGVTATELIAQTYTVTVTDNITCTKTYTVTITQPTALNATVGSQTNVSCNGGTDGSASVSPSGGTPTYTYLWSNGQTTSEGTNLTAGIYTVWVSDSNGCTATRDYIITQPSAISIASASQTNVSCNGGSNGAASVSTPTGGAGGYTYDWTPGNPTGDGTASVSGLTAGTWTCTVTDANSCAISQSFTITQPSAISLTPASQTNIACNGGSNGAASVNTPTGGAGGYTYDWTPGTPTGDGTTSVSGLTAGTWTCTVTDANGCTESQNFTITQPATLGASINSYTNVSCSGNANGTATVSVSGGTAPYNYSWSPSGGTAASASGLAAGTYTVTITDANSCVTSANVEIIEPQVSAHLYRSGNPIGDYCTIQAAVDASQDGDVVNIDAGTYAEQVTITKGITLQGAGRDLTIIESPDANHLAISGGNWKNMKNQDMFDIIGIKTTNDAPVTIKDLKVDGRDQGFITYPKYDTDKGLYDFHGIGAYNTSVTIDNVYVTGIRNLANQFATNQGNQNNVVPSDYLPTVQPAGINHNDAIFAESSSSAGEHTFTLTNSYITKFQKTAVLVWGPTLTVDIKNNTIQGYGQTLWSTGNGVQVASSDRSGQGEANDDRRGTKGSVTNNQMLGMGIVIPEPGQPGSYLNLGLYSPAGVLLYEAGDDFVISGNTFERSNQTKSWHVDFTSNDGGYGNVAIDITSSNGTVISNNTINGYDEAIITETSSTVSSIIASNNTVLNNTIDYGTFFGANQITLGNNDEVLAYYHNTVGNNEISNFGPGDKIQVVKLSSGVVNGMSGTLPSIDYTDGSVTEGTGTTVAAYSVQIHYDGTQTSLYIDTDGTANQAELVLKLNGEYTTENFKLDGAFIKYKNAKPTLTTTSVSTFFATSAFMGGNVTFNGGTPVTERGVVYNTTGNPTVLDSKVQMGSGSGGFSQTVAGLNPNTTYYVKAYAVNSSGTNYGGVQSFTTSKLSQSINFEQLAHKTYGDSDFAPEAGTTSGLNVSFTTSNPTVATIVGNKIHIVGAGSCIIYAYQSGNDSYFSETSVGQTLNVGKATLVVTAETQTKVYGTPNPTLTVRYSGWKNNENEMVLDTKPSIVTTVDLMTPAGTHANAISASGGVDNNYDFTYVAADFEVAKSLLSITANAQSKEYDGNTIAIVSGGQLVGVLNGDMVSLTLGSASFSDKNAGTDKVVTVAGSSITGSGAGNYSLTEVSGLKASITPKQLTIANTSVQVNKIFDNSTIATIKSIGTLQGLATGDANSVDVSAAANYNDAVIGAGKTITTVFSISGNAAGNYLKPADLIVSGAEISEKISLDETMDVPVTGECQGEDLYVGYHILSGTPAEYQIIFDAAAHLAGFKDTGYLPLPSTQNQDKLYINIPANMVEGVYIAKLQFRNSLKFESPVYPFEFTIKLSKDHLVTKFDDVILCDNSSNHFKTYQWYKDGKLIPGATEQFYNDPSGIDGIYSLQVGTTDGAILWSCEKEVHALNTKNATISAYPNPAKSSESFTIKITNLSNDDLEGAVMRIYSITGSLVQTVNVVKQINSVTLPLGEYLGTVITSDQKKYTYKITVANL